MNACNLYHSKWRIRTENLSLKHELKILLGESFGNQVTVAMAPIFLWFSISVHLGGMSVQSSSFLQYVSSFWLHEQAFPGATIHLLHLYKTTHIG